MLEPFESNDFKKPINLFGVQTFKSARKKKGKRADSKSFNKINHKFSSGKRYSDASIKINGGHHL